MSRRLRRLLLVAAALAVSALAPAAAAGSRVLVADGSLGYKPASLNLSGNGDLVAAHLRWRDWGRGSAVAHGVAVLEPRSGDLHRYHYPARVNLGHRHYCRNLHRTAYDDIKLTLLGRRRSVFGARVFHWSSTCNTSFTILAASAAAAPRPIATAAGPRVYLHTLDVTRLFYKPHSFWMSGDSTLAVEALRWPTWGGTSAVAHGVAAENDCTPDCARGAFHHFPARVTLSGRVACHRLHHTVYTVTTLTILGHRRPLGGVHVQKLTAPCHGYGTLT